MMNQNKEDDLKPLSLRHKAIKKIGIGLFNFWLIAIIFLFIFLGALQAKYQYESTLIQDVNMTLGLAGLTFVKVLTRNGAESPNFWLIIYPIIIIFSFYFNVFDVIKEERINFKKIEEK